MVPIDFIKAAATGMRYFARSKFFGSLVHNKNFGLIWQVVLKLRYLFCQGRLPLLSLNELGKKSQTTIILGKFVNKPSSNFYRINCYRFEKMLFIGQNLKHVHMTSSFLERLIFFWLILVNIYCLEFISLHQRYTNMKEIQIATHFHLSLIMMLKNLVFFSCKVKTLYQQLLIFPSFIMEL